MPEGLRPPPYSLGIHNPLKNKEHRGLQHKQSHTDRLPKGWNNKKKYAEGQHSYSFKQTSLTGTHTHPNTKCHTHTHSRRHETLTTLPQKQSLATPEDVWFCRKPYLGQCNPRQHRWILLRNYSGASFKKTHHYNVQVYLRNFADHSGSLEILQFIPGALFDIFSGQLMSALSQGHEKIPCILQRRQARVHH